MWKTAFRFLRYDKAKSIGALLGVIISTFLIGQQAGIFIFLTDTMRTLTRMNPEYVWVVDNQTENVNQLGQLDIRLKREIESINGVDFAEPIFIGGATVQFPGGQSSPIQLIGLKAPNFAGKPINIIDGSMDDLIPAGAVCVDYFDESVFKRTDLGTTFEINGYKAYIAARTKGVRGFGASYVFTTIERALAWSNAPPTAASAFLVKTKANYSRDSVISLINRTIFNVRAWKGETLGSSTVRIILRTTSIATSVGTLVIFAFIAGFFIIGLTLYSAAIDRVKDYGTMKAIGATNTYITKLIFMQAGIFAVTGFLIGYALIMGFKQGVAQSGLFFEFKPIYIIALIIMVIIIAVGGATFAARRISKLEPASVFK